MIRLLFLFLLLFSLAGFSQEVINIDGVGCGLNGAATPGSRVYLLNEYKNRYAFPKSTDFDQTIGFQDLIHSGDPNQFSPDKAISLTGYVFNVKLGGIESCNCKTKDPAYRDTHIELTPDDTHTDASNRVIVEVTPRIRAMMAAKGLDWSTEGLRHSIKGHRVTIKGWLLYDVEHESGAFANDPEDQIGARNWRATCWEIHPVTSIDVLNPGDIPNLPNKRHTKSPLPPKEERRQPQENQENQGNANFVFVLLGLLVVIIIIVLLLYSNSRK